MANWETQRDENKETIAEFNRVWHETIDGTWHTTRWLGVKVLKTPCDLMVYQELITKIRPSLIIETGTCFGGSALFMATVCQSIGAGIVLSIDIKKPRRPVKHGRIIFHTANSLAPATVEFVKRRVQRYPGPVMVILDSDHRKRHVSRELELYSPFVTKGSYLIVEDTNINRAVRKDHGPGPGDAVDDFLATTDRFVVDPECEKYFLTFNPGGYLQCVR